MAPTSQTRDRSGGLPAMLRPGRNLCYLAALWRWASEAVVTIRRRRRDPRPSVAVDISPFWEPLSGIGWYLYRLLEALADREDLVLRLYGPDVVVGPRTPEARRAPVVPPPAGRALEHVVHRLDAPRDAVLAILLDPLLRRVARALIAADRNRAVFAPNYFPSPRFDVALARGAPLVATVHDLGYLRTPWTMRASTLEELRDSMHRTWREAAVVLTDSRAVRDEIVAAGLTAPERLETAPLAPAHRPDGTAAPPEGTPARYGLFVGTVEPRKNLETLLRAWERLPPAEDGRPVPLVVCGRIGWKAEEAVRRLARGRRRGWLMHFDSVADAELGALYRDALLLALPSHYEGYGLPAAEACAAGTPMVLSDLPVLREVAGDAALYAPPHRPDLWREAIARLLGDPELRHELGRRGRAAARHLSWRRTAERTAEVLLRAAREGVA